MAEEMDDGRTHQRNVRKQHQALVDFWLATIANCGYGQYAEHEQVAVVEYRCEVSVQRHGSGGRVRVDLLIPAQIEAAPHHCRRRRVAQWDHQSKQDYGGQAEPSVPANVSGRNQQALSEEE